MPYQTLLFSIVLIFAIVLVYRPVMRIARRDMAARSRAGLSNAYVYAILLFPVFGPLLYLLVRRGMLPKE